MLKKCTFTVLFTVLAMAGVSAAATITPVIPNKDGDNCYLISDAQELYGFAAIVNGTIVGRDAEPTACGVLTADIVVNENVLTLAGELNTAPTGGFTPWTPIGTFDNWFTGSFDGQGHTISGLYFNNEESAGIGLFGIVVGSVETSVSISNVGIEDSYFYAGGSIGGVVGEIDDGTVNIENVYNAAVVEGSSVIGGIVGGAYGIEITLTLKMVNVYNVGSIGNGGSAYVGGLVGQLYDDIGEETEKNGSVVIEDSYNYGKVVSCNEKSGDNCNPFVGSVEYGLVVSVTNSFYLASEKVGDYGTNMSATDFSNGTVYAALHSAEGGEVWRQYSGDKYPVLVEKTGTPMHTVVLHYSETDSVAIAYTQGTALTLPTELPDGSIVVGDWYKANTLSGTSYTQVASTENGDLNFYAKVMKLDDDGYYEIDDADMLFKFADLVNNDNSTYGFAKAKLTADIVVNKNVLVAADGKSNVNAETGEYIGADSASFRKWTPIGDNIKSTQISFNGSFDGQGHTISGLFLNKGKGKDEEYSSLFGIVGGAADNETVSIKNVGIEDSYFSAQANVSGFVAFSNAYSLKIENCYSAATLYGLNNLGGLVGIINSYNTERSLTIENSYNFGTIKYYSEGSPSGTGALVGNAGNYANVVNSYYFDQEGLIKGEYGTAATSEAFGNGIVALLLHGEGASVWGQKVGTDSHPNFYKGIEGASPSENGPGVVENGSLRSITVTLHYSEEATDTSKFEHVVGIFEKLPAMDKKGNFVLGWYKNASFEGDKYVEVSTAENDLDFYAKIMKAVDGCYQIADAEMLFEFADMVNDQNETYGGACAKLTADIVVNKNVLANVEDDGSPRTGVSFTPWTPIGAGDSPFAGTFDGQGHTISGLYFNDGEKSSVGLFGYVAGSGKTVSISNVGVEDSYFRAYADVGGIIGGVDGEVTLNIENVYNAATVVGDEDGFDVGGIVGDVTGGFVFPTVKINNAYNIGTIVGDYVGGLVGSVDAAESVDITNSYNYGSVACSYNGCDQGALVGYVDGAKVAVTNSYYLGDAENGDYGTNKSAAEFSNGSVYAALHSAEDGEVWRQYKDDAYPTLVAKTGTDAPAPMHVAVLHYSETDSVAIAYTEGTAFTLPTTLPDGSIVVGDWYETDDLSGTSYTQIAATENGDLSFYAKAFKPNAEGYYEIATADDLYKFAAIVNNGTVPDAKAMLVADICVNACGDGESVLGENNANVDATTGEYTGSTSGLREWTPIGNWYKPFQGSFDGQGHTISGLYFNNTDAEYAGLFGAVDGTVTIDNVGLVDSYIMAGSYAGGLVGYAQGSLTINNSYNASSVNAPGQTFGGLVGAASDDGSSLAISNSYNVGPLNGKGFGGGLVGFANKLVVTNSYNAGPIYNNDDKHVYVGGITSSVTGATTITNCFNYGAISYPSNISVTVDDLVAKVDNDAKVTVTNSFTIGESKFEGGGSTKVTSDEFSDGTVLIALRSGDGGNVWVQNPNDKYPSIDINAKNANTIVLDWTSAADSTTLVGAGYTDGAVVIVKAGKTFYADGKIYEGVLSAEQVAAIGQNKLYPISGVELETVGNKLVAYLDGDSYETLMISTDVKVDSVVYTRTVKNDLALTTVMLPFSVSLSSITGASKFYKFNGMDINSTTNRYEVHVSGVATDVGLVANTPYIMKPSCENGKIVLEAQGSLTLNTLNGSYVQSVNKDGVTWTMQGVYEYKVWEDGPNSELGSVYGITAENMNGAKIGEFKKLGAGASIQPMRMYLKRTVATSPRPGLTPAFARVEEGPVNIDVVVDDDEQQTMLVKRISVVPTVVKSNRWFDMKGRALGGKPTTKGTYYYNGKRIIIK